MRPLTYVEEQRARNRIEHLRRRVDVAALLEPRVPRHAHAGELRHELRHLLAAKTGCAPPPGRPQPDLLGRDPLATGAQERSQLVPANVLGVGIREGLNGLWYEGVPRSSGSAAPVRLERERRPQLQLAAA